MFFAEKSRLTYRFIKTSYAQITRLTTAVENVLHKIQNSGESSSASAEIKIYLYGPRNEVLEILNMVLGKGQIKHTYIAAGGLLPDPSPDIVVIVWDLTDEEKLSPSYRTINLLKELS